MKRENKIESTVNDLDKPAYNTPKAFRPIVLFNTLGKLIEKMIARQLQFDAVKLSQIRYLLVVILELNGVSEVQYKNVMMISINKNN